MQEILFEQDDYVKLWLTLYKLRLTFHKLRLPQLKKLLENVHFKLENLKNGNRLKEFYFELLNHV